MKKLYLWKVSLLVQIAITGLCVFAQTGKNVPAPVLEERLAIASRLCQTDVVKNLLAQKVSPNSRDRFNQPAILLAFRCDRVLNERAEKISELVKILAEAGADVNVRNEFGVTPYLAAEIFDYINQSAKDKNPNYSKLTAYLVSKGSDPNTKDIYNRNGFQHLHNADTGETREEQIWRQVIEGNVNFDLNPKLLEDSGKFELAKTDVFRANSLRFGKLKASLSMAAVYYNSYGLSKVLGAAISNVHEETDDEGENVIFYAMRGDNPFLLKIIFGRTIFSEGNKLTEDLALQKFNLLLRESLKKRNNNGKTPVELSYPLKSFAFQSMAHLYMENPNEADSEGLTPLLHTLQDDSPVLISLLMNDKVNPNLPSKTGVYPLLYAAEKNSYEQVLLLLYGIKNPYYSVGKNIQKISFANINQTDSNGKTALMIAAEKGSSDILKFLLANGANIYLKDKNGETALSLARKNNHSSIVYRLFNLMKTPAPQDFSKTSQNKTVSENQTPLMKAAQNGNLTAIRNLLKSGAKIDEVDSDGRTALFYAILNDEVYAAKLLIQAKANVNHLADGKATPLMAAARFKADQIIPFLLQAGAKPNEKDKFGKTALIWAAEKSDIETVNQLLKGKPNVNLKDPKGISALIYSIKKDSLDNKDVIKILLKHGANPNDTDESKDNSIKIAVKTRQDNLFLLLLKAGANPFQKGAFDFDTFTELGSKYGAEEGIYSLIYENSLPKYRPKTDKDQ